MSYTNDIASFAATFDLNDIPDHVSGRALALATDLIGSAIRAAKESESTPAVLAMIQRLGLTGGGDCTVFGMDRRYGPAAAALLNGALGHSLDFDDTHAESSLHPSAPVVPAALAAAEITGATGKELLGAIVLGLEITCRLGVALDPAAHYARGFHPTATAGVFGAAVAAGRLLKLDTRQIISAFGTAASQAAGSLQFLVNGAWNKRYQVGEASMKGLIAATLAAEGFEGAIDAIDGKHGFLSAYSDGADPHRAAAGLGQIWETMRIGVKPYPACRYTHAAVDGLLALRRQLDLTPADIESITIGLHRNGIVLVGDPIGEKRRVRAIVDGQFSMPFAAAVAVIRGRFGWDDYDLIGAEMADDLSDRVTVVRDELLEGHSHPFGAIVKLRARGELHRMFIADPSGEPASFPDDDAIATKFRILASPVMNGEEEALLLKLRSLPEADNMRNWFK